MLENGNGEEIVTYLKALQELAAFVAGYNKPMLMELEGTLKNAAGSIFTQVPMANNIKPLKIIFDEASKGYPLLGGVSYTLSRLPPGAGKYLALTGKPVTGGDIW